MSNVVVRPNSNFTSIKGNNTPDNASEEYLMYRECWNQYPKEFILRDMPLHLDVEASSRCNLRYILRQTASVKTGAVGKS